MQSVCVVEKMEEVAQRDRTRKEMEQKYTLCEGFEFTHRIAKKKQKAKHRFALCTHTLYTVLRRSDRNIFIYLSLRLILNLQTRGKEHTYLWMGIPYV